MNDTYKVIQPRERFNISVKKNSGVDNIERAGWLSIEELYNSYTEAGKKYVEYLKDRYPEARPIGDIKDDIVEGVEEDLQALDIAQRDVLDYADYVNNLNERAKNLQAQYNALQEQIKKAQSQKIHPQDNPKPQE